MVFDDVAISDRLSTVTVEEIVPRFLKPVFLKFHDVESDAFAVIGLPASTIASIQTILMPHANTFFKPFFAFTL